MRQAKKRHSYDQCWLMAYRNQTEKSYRSQMKKSHSCSQCWFFFVWFLSAINWCQLQLHCSFSCSLCAINQHWLQLWLFSAWLLSAINQCWLQSHCFSLCSLCAIKVIVVVSVDWWHTQSRKKNSTVVVSVSWWQKKVKWKKVIVVASVDWWHTESRQRNSVIVVSTGW